MEFPQFLHVDINTPGLAISHLEEVKSSTQQLNGGHAGLLERDAIGQSYSLAAVSSS